MRTLRFHGPILLLLLAITFTAFGYLLDTPLYHGLDMQILCDAHRLSQNPSPVSLRAGFFFSQPLLELSFLAEYNLFGLNPTGYLAVNLFLHACNAFVVYMLVNMLFPNQRIALLAAILFTLGVGSYGKVFMNLHQLESLLLANLHLLVLYFFIRNDFRREGRLRSPFFLIGLGLFLLTGLTKAASFSLISCLIAYKAFFYKRRGGRAIFSNDIIAFIIVGALFYTAQWKWGYHQGTLFESPTNAYQFSWISFKNIFRYLNLMFFPIQTSPILEQSAAWVVWVYDARTVIRVLLAISIISFSFFGFVFGSRAIRFFIAWTYLTVLPFTGQVEGSAWLNLNHLYLTSVGFCIILATGARGTSNLLARARWRRFVPYSVPLFFILVSLGLTNKLHDQNLAKARSPEIVAMREEIARTCHP